MNNINADLLVPGLIATIVGLFIIVKVIFQLAPSNSHKWLLGMGLGSGVIAFSFKLFLIVTFSTFPKQVLEFHSKQDPTFRHTSISHTKQTTEALPSQMAYTWEALPDSAPHPANNPATAEKIALGKTLFFDTRLSLDNSLSCASCHKMEEKTGGGDGRPQSVGIYRQKGTRNAPTVLNAAFQQVLFWDGRADSLEEQAKGPLTNPIEMGMPSYDAVQERVRKQPKYQQAFSIAFPGISTITIEHITKAIATYERTLITPNTPYDRFIKGDTDALSQNQLRGMELFESIGCILCHSGPNFSGASIFGNTAMYRIFPAIPNTKYEDQYRLTDDLGKANHGSDRGVWRIPSLRNVSRTAPYFHNGSVDTLEEAVRIMAKVQLNKKLSNNSNDNKSLQWSDKNKQFSVSNNQALTDDEINDIVAFLHALNGEILVKSH